MLDIKTKIYWNLFCPNLGKYFLMWFDLDSKITHKGN